RSLLLFQFLDAGQSQPQVFLHLTHLSLGLAEGFSQPLVFRSKTSDFFLLRHGLSLPARSSLNSFSTPRRGTNRLSCSMDATGSSPRSAPVALVACTGQRTRGRPHALSRSNR